MSFSKMISIVLASAFLAQAKPVQARPLAKPQNTSVLIRKSKSRQPLQARPVISTHSYVVLNQNTAFLTSTLRKSKKKAWRGRGYRIYYLKRQKNQLYYATKNKLWLPAKLTHGTVWYQENNNTVVLATNKKGQLSYSFYDLTSQVKNLVVRHNAYVYRSNGQVQRNQNGTVTVLKKGRRLRGYYMSKVNGQNFYITNNGWVKAKNVAVVKEKSRVNRGQKSSQRRAGLFSGQKR